MSEKHCWICGRSESEVKMGTFHDMKEEHNGHGYSVCVCEMCNKLIIELCASCFADPYTIVYTMLKKIAKEEIKREHATGKQCGVESAATVCNASFQEVRAITHAVAPHSSSDVSLVDECTQWILREMYLGLNEDLLCKLHRACKKFYLDECSHTKPSARAIAAAAVWLSGYLCTDYPIDRATQKDISRIAGVSITSMRNVKNVLLAQKKYLRFYRFSEYV